MNNLNPTSCNKVLFMRGFTVEGRNGTDYQLIDRLDENGITIDFWNLGLPPSQLELDLTVVPNITLQKTSIPDGVKITAVTVGYSGNYHWRCVSPDGSVDYAFDDAANFWDIGTGQLGNYEVWCGVPSLGVAVITFEGE